ncbi:MAG TPA: SIS domain-containing protein [Candidatus Obscuribacterales bacterium]
MAIAETIFGTYAQATAPSVSGGLAAAYFAKLHELLISTTATTASKTRLSLDVAMHEAMASMWDVQATGKKVMLIGNGGSAAIASHQALDLWKAAGIRAISFNDAAQLTCLGNDFGYDKVFSKAIEMFAEPGDILIAISSSGRSPNIIDAVRAAKQTGCHVITFAGFDPHAPLVAEGDLNFYVNCDQYGLVEVAHMTLIHYLSDSLRDKGRSEA